MKTGLLALDIDGTVSEKFSRISDELSKYLTSLEKAGWVLLFPTGRTLKWSSVVLDGMLSSYFIAPQNGAFIVSFPSQEVILRRYLESSCIEKLASCLRQFGSSFALYLGPENDEKVYYCKNHFSKEEKNYLLKRAGIIQEKWHELEDFSCFPSSLFSSLRIFVFDKELARPIQEMIRRDFHFSCPIMSDSICSDFRIIQVTREDASKAMSVKALQEKLSIKGPTIAAGDDLNDIELLEAADIPIAMSSAPEELKKRAKLIAPSTKELIFTLQEAIGSL
jgi:Cof subfamily protein (haloacid dehalogenase superfamily)